MKPKTTHTSFAKGSKIRMIFTDGSVAIGKFIQKLSDRKIYVEFLDGRKGEVNINSLRSCNYYKPLPHEL